MSINGLVPEVVVVEDDPDIRELTARAIGRHPSQPRVVTFENGSATLEYLHPENADDSSGRPWPRLVLLDLKMPGMSGLEVLSRIREDPRTRNLPVVVMTSSREPRDVSESYNRGVNSYCVKPLDLTEFESIVNILSTYWVDVNEPPLRPV